MRRLPLLVPVAAIAGVVAWAEFVHHRSTGRRLGTAARSGTSEAVVILGYRNRGTRANLLNRYRVRAGLRSRDPHASESVLVLCGGGVASSVSEAELMARYARRRGYTGPIRLDRDSSTTWENIQNAIPFIEDADAIKIVSNSLHAEKGRAHLWKLRPDLADRLVRAEDHRLGELALVKPLAAVLGLRSLRGQ
ncbi:galactitol-specific phosphotransferase system IIB component [Agromyces cerinus]|uniref:YdcF family protein n=1 Tax=Agromyces cerinus TaxID=33878 RepID=UPI00195EFBCF|nr:YdcF family protein [Agromyces cerinus]MBM7830644.1 galactitol-specific phosphotransferase system IIB component [Agromyces cerinus]